MFCGAAAGWAVRREIKSVIALKSRQVIMCFSGLSAYQDTKQTGHTLMVVLIVRFLSVVCGPSREDTRKEGQKHSKDYAGCSVLVNDGS
jgi:hypothetical protein